MPMMYHLSKHRGAKMEKVLSMPIATYLPTTGVAGIKPQGLKVFILIT